MPNTTSRFFGFRLGISLCLAVALGSADDRALTRAGGGSAEVHSGVGAGHFHGVPTRPPEFQEMAQGQSPHTLLITCSDSRLVPSLMTGTGIGELFVIRNAGNVVVPYDGRPESVTATIEYAVAVLEVPKIVVCGHTRCGAMKAALEPESLATIPSVRNFIRFVEPARLVVDALHPGVGPETRWYQLVRQNVLQQIANLRTHPWVAARMASGRIQLEGWVYGLDSRQIVSLP